MQTSHSKQGLPQLIVTRILRDGHVTLTQLEHRATERGVLLSDLYAALDSVHRDKRIRQGVSNGEVHYEPARATAPPSLSHLTWIKDNYPPMTPDNDGSGIELDLSWMFLRTPEERDAYRAQARGVPRHMIQSRHGK